MKRIQLIETGIIAIILILVYHLITTSMELIINLFVVTETSLGIAFYFLLPTIVFIILYVSFIYLLVRYKKPLAKWINGRDSEESTGSLSIQSVLILHSVIIIFCFLTIFKELPRIVYFLITLFTPNETFLTPQESYDGPEMYTDPDETIIVNNNFLIAEIWNPIIRISFAIILLLFSKKISSFWYKRNSKEDNNMSY